MPTRALKALPNTLFATRGLPKVMQLMSASGYSTAAHAAPVIVKSKCSDRHRMESRKSNSMHLLQSKDAVAQHSTAQHSAAQHSSDPDEAWHGEREGHQGLGKVNAQQGTAVLGSVKPRVARAPPRE